MNALSGLFFIGNGYDEQVYRFIGTLLIKVEFVLMVSLLGKYVDDKSCSLKKLQNKNCNWYF